MDCTDIEAIRRVIEKYKIDTIYHLAALLSAVAEGNPQLILDLGEGLTDINIWTYAAYSFLKVEQLGSPIPEEELKDKIREALFRAAFEDISVEVFSRNQDIELDPAFLNLLKARKALLEGRVDEAENLVDRVNTCF